MLNKKVRASEFCGESERVDVELSFHLKFHTFSCFWSFQKFSFWVLSYGADTFGLSYSFRWTLQSWYILLDSLFWVQFLGNFLSSFWSNFWGGWLGFATSVGFLQVVAYTRWCTLMRMMMISLHSSCHIVDWYCLFALHYYQYGWYVADVSLHRMFPGQAPAIPNLNIYSECGVPHFRVCSEFQMGAYFVWRVAAVSWFTNREKHYLRVLFRTSFTELRTGSSAS
jgi:hypothetical protein